MILEMELRTPMKVRIGRLHGSRLEIRARGVSTIVDRLEEDDGPGDGFRPVELLLGSLGSCMLGTMLTFADNQNIPVENVSLELSPVIGEHPERVARVDMTMRISGDVTERQLQSLQRVAGNCKITNTLRGEVVTALSVRAVAAEAVRRTPIPSQGGNGDA